MWEGIMRLFESGAPWAQLLIASLIFLGMFQLGNWGIRQLANFRGQGKDGGGLTWVRAGWIVLIAVSWLACLVYLFQIPGPFAGLQGYGEELVSLFQATWAKLLFIFFLGGLSWQGIEIVAARIQARQTRTRQSIRQETVQGVLESGLKTILLVVVAIMALQSLGYDPTGLLAGLGIAGLALSFGAQDLVRDFLTGSFVLLEDQYGVGDRISINGGELVGDVERLTLRVTVLRHRQSGAIHIIPNGEIKMVTVERKGRDWNRVKANARLSYDDDLEKGLEVFTQVCQDLYDDAQWQDAFVGKPIIQGVQDLGEYSLQLRALLTVRPSKQGQVMREFNKRIVLAFKNAGLDIAPCRHVSLQDPIAVQVGEPCSPPPASSQDTSHL